jgi:hypothetical protein
MYKVGKLRRDRLGDLVVDGRIMLNGYEGNRV